MAWFSKWRNRPPSKRSETLDAVALNRPIVLPQEPTDAEIRAAVGSWIELMAVGDYAQAVSAVFRNPPAPEKFREEVEGYCLGLAAARQRVVDGLRARGYKVSDPPAPESFTRAQVIPASPSLLEAVQIHRDGIPPEAAAWLAFHIPLDNRFGSERPWAYSGQATDAS